MTSDLARSWDDAAAGYDAYFVPRFAPWVADAVRPLGAAALPDGPIVVPCCGPLPELPYLERVQPGRRIVGLDLSAGMIAQAREHYGDRAALIVGDAVRLDAIGERPAAIVSVFGLQQLPDPAGALRAWEAALPPDGLLSVMWWPPVVETSGPYALLNELRGESPDDERASWSRDARNVTHEMTHPGAAQLYDALVTGGPMRAWATRVGPADVADLRARFVTAAPDGPWTHAPTALHVVRRRPPA